MPIAIKPMKPVKAARPSEVCEEISVCGKVGISVMLELCQRVLNEKEILHNCINANIQGIKRLKKL